jgi:hypothetical protein
MKPITNYRDHPTLKYDSQQSVFVIEQKMYLLTEDCVVRIVPLSLDRTNIGEPYAELVRFSFKIDEQIEIESLDIDPKYTSNLLAMCSSIGVELVAPKLLR